MKNQTIVIGAGVGLLIWYFGFGPGKRTGDAIATPVNQPLLPDIGLPSFLPPVANAATSNMTAIPSPGANASTASGSNPSATVAQQTILFNWANTFPAGDQAAFYANYPNFSQSEIAGLLDLINTWTTGGPITQARTDFWNNWRLKYKIHI